MQMKASAVMAAMVTLAACSAEATPSAAVFDVDPPDGMVLARTTEAVDLVVGPGTGTRHTVGAGELIVRFTDDERADADLVVIAGPGGPGPTWLDAEASRLLEPAAPDCPEGPPSVPLLVRLAAVAPFCVGAAPFELIAYVPGFCAIVGGPFPEVTPAWMDRSSRSLWTYGEDPPGDDEANPPASGVLSLIPAEGVEMSNCDERGIARRWQRFTVHFDDPAARQCRARWPRENGVGFIEEDVAASVASCRLSLVATAFEPVGAPDP